MRSKTKLHYSGCNHIPGVQPKCPECTIERLTAESKADKIRLADMEATCEFLHETEAENERLEGALYRSGFVPCDIPACNCGSWHHVGGFAARFREIDEATEAFWKNGETLLDRIKRIAATEQGEGDD